MRIRRKIVYAILGIAISAVAIFSFFYLKPRLLSNSQQKYQTASNKHFSKRFHTIINSNNQNLIFTFIKENREKYRTEIGKLIAEYLQYRLKGDFLKAKREIDSAKKAAIFLKLYFQDEFYINLIKFNIRLSNKEIALKRKANNIYRSGLKEYSQENFQQAFNKFREAEKIYESINDKFNKGNIYHAYGNIYFYFGDYDKALEEYEKAFQLAKEFKDTKLKIISIINSGLIYSNIGDYSRALKNFRIALNGSKSAISELYERNVMNYMANVYYKLGDYDTSSRIYNLVLQKSASANDIKMQAKSLKNIGINLIMQNDFKEAEKYLLKSLKIKAKSGSLNQYATALNSLASVNIKSGNNKKALKYLKKSLNISRKAANPLILADCLSKLGEVYTRLKNYEKAIACLQECLKVCENIDNPYLVCRFYRSSGIALKHRKKLKEAESHFIKSIDLIEKKRAGIEEDYLKSSYLATIKGIYEDMILFQIMDLNNQLSALQFSERSRARAFLDMLGGRAKVIFSKKNFMVEREPDEKRLTELSANYRLRSSSEKSPFNSAIRGESKEPEIISPSVIAPYQIEEIQQTLDHNCKILEYEITEENIVIWVISRNDIKNQIVAANSEELRNLIIDLRKTLTLEDSFLERYRTWAERIEETDGLAKKLYNILFKPIRKFLNKGDLLYIIPDDELFYIPFASLKSEEGRYIIEDYDLAYVPSASILKLCLAKNRGKINPEEDSILLAGNPLISENILNNFPSLNPLIHAEKEIKIVASIFPHSFTLLRAEAREDKIRAKIKDFEIIHLASHSLIDERMPLYSSIILSPSSNISENFQIENPDDGLLMLPEVFSLNLSRSKLIVLSSCETGLGKLFKGEGIIGLSRAFMYAGSPSMLASLWKVEDESTSLLFQRFYSNIKRESSSKAKALKYAQLCFIKNQELEEYRHPYFWSSFIIIGDGS